MVALPIVEVPGYREAVKRERFLRDAAWLDGNETLCGEDVVPLCLRRLIWLEQAHNGFICPWRWEDDDELIGHALAFVYFLKPHFHPSKLQQKSFLKRWVLATREHNLRVRLLSRLSPEKLIEEIHAYLSDCFMDAPSGGGNNVANISYASWPTYILDKFGEAGLTYTADQILDMPIKRLWQHYRVATARINDAKLTNPSDDIAVAHIARIKDGHRN